MANNSRRPRAPRQTSADRIILSCSVKPDQAAWFDQQVQKLGTTRNQLIAQCIKTAVPILLSARKDWPNSDKR